MDPSLLSCPNLACPDKGLTNAGNIRVQARAERRYCCRTCGRTFTATTNTPFYRLHHPAATMALVLTLLHGCPSPRRGAPGRSWPPSTWTSGRCGRGRIRRGAHAGTSWHDEDFQVIAVA